MQRRNLLRGGFALGATSLVGCHRLTALERVLSSIAEELVAPSVAEASARSEDLTRALAELKPGFTPLKFEGAERAWRAAALAWKRAGTFRDGPFQEGNALLRATRSPARPGVIEGVLSEARAIDANRVAELGSGEKGLYAIEYLLFGVNETPALARWQSAKGPRLQALAHGLASELTQLAGKIELALGRNAKHLRAALLANPQGGLGRLVKTLIEGIESLAESPFARIWQLTELHRLTPADVEGYWSKSSHRLSLARLESTEQLYRGGEYSLSSLVRARVPNADASLHERFDNSLAAMRAVNAPLEEFASRERSRFYECYLKLKSLEKGMKVHLPSALGLTLTFSSGDAD